MSTALFGGGNSKNMPVYTGLRVQTSALNIPIPILWGRTRTSFNLIWWNDFQRHKHSSGKGGGKGGQYTYSVAALLGICWGTTSSVPTVYTNQAKSTLAALGLTLFTGTAAQTPFGYITTNHPTQALSYPNVSYLASSSLNLDGSPTLPSISLEVVGNLSGTMPGTVDVNMGDVIPDFLTNSLYGMGLTAGNIGASVADYKTYVQAQGLFMSPVIATQEKASGLIDRWAMLTNSWIFWSGNEMKFVPLGDKAITAHSATYTPVTTIRYDLGPGDFIDAEPVQINRIDPADAYNRTRVEIRDRALDYNSNPIEYKDQTLIDKYGVRDNSSIQGQDICDAAVGLIVATLLGKRAAFQRNTYSFRTSHRFVRLEPGDIVTLTDPSIPAITLLPVRIISVDCDEDGALSFTAEDYTGNTSRTVPYTPEPGVPITFDTLVAPGPVNPPCIFEPNSDLSPEAQVWIAASGGQYWGGADVFISFDNITYAQIGTITQGAKQGVLTAGLASHADPDTVNTLAVNLAVSLQQLDTATHADADARRSLCLVAPAAASNGELISYGSVASTGTYTDNLTYLRRANYGTAAASHSTGDQFTLLDLAGTSGSLIKYALPPQYVGATIYFKFTSFNIYGKSEEDISTVTVYGYVPTGAGFGGGTAGAPTVPTGFAASPSTTQNVLTWNANPATDNVNFYNLYRANGTGAAFGSSALLWTGAATSFLDTTIVSGAGYTYFLSASNTVGEGGHTAGVNATSATVTGVLRISGGTPGRKPGDGEVLFTIPMKTGDVLPANLTGSDLRIDTNESGVAPTSTWTVVLKKNNTTIFTGTIASSATVGSFGAGSSVSFTDGDFLSAKAISPQDATCIGVSYTFIGTRTQ